MYDNAEHISSAEFLCVPPICGSVCDILEVVFTDMLFFIGNSKGRTAHHQFFRYI
jgi:hypothetical protein